MLTDLANVMGRRIADSIDLIEKDQATLAVRAALSTARDLLCASKAEVRQVAASNTFGRPDVLRRFACSPPDLEDSRKRDYEVTERGFWTYVYKKNISVWVQNPNHDKTQIPDDESVSTQHDVDRSGKAEYCGPIKNEIPNSLTIPSMYNFADQGSECVVVIPFKKKIEEAESCWGILDLEFEHPVRYSEDQHKALELLTDHIANIVWKTKAWERTTTDTKRVVKQFEEWCKQASGATLPYKTGLLIRHDYYERRLFDDLFKWFGDSGVQMDEYNLQSQTATLDVSRGLEIRQIIEKEHFGVVDLTRHEQAPGVLVILGMLTMISRPCLVLYSGDSPEEMPSIVQSIGQQQAVAGEPLLHVYQYDIDGDNIVFSRRGVRVEKSNVLQTFLQSVRKQSQTFCVAHDFV